MYREKSIKLNRESIEDILALTPLQEGMLFHYWQNPKDNVYHEQLSLEISGNIDIKIFKLAWEVVVETNEMLRTKFHWEKAQKPVQVIFREHLSDLRYYDFSLQDQDTAQRQLAEVKIQDRQEKFDLRLPPFRVTLCKVKEEKFEMIISHHHILFDGWSTGIILKEFFKAYHDGSQGQRPLAVVKNKFKEFVKYLRDQDREPKPGAQAKFWLEYLKDFEGRTGLTVKTRVERPVRDGDNGDDVEKFQHLISRDMTAKLWQLAQGRKITLAAVFYTAWGLLLQRYNNCNDVIFGTTVSGRSAGVKGINEMVGLFINTLPLRMRNSGQEKIEALLEEINRDLQQREEYSLTPLVKIMEYSGMDYKHRKEWIDSLVVIENYPLDISIKYRKEGLKVLSYSMSAVTHYDLTAAITPLEGDRIEVILSYSPSLFTGKVIKGLARHFLRILEEMVENPHQRISDIEILSTEEKKKILDDFNRTQRQFTENKTITSLFEEQVKRTPDHIAAAAYELAGLPRKEKLHITNDKFQSHWKGTGSRGDVPLNHIRISYKELNHQAHQLALLLMEKGVRPDAIVAIMMEPSLEMVIGILGILKSGGAYLPMDLGFPEERIKYLLVDSEVQVLLNLSGEHQFNCQLSMSSQSPTPYPLPPATPANPSNLAYVIYTSGTIGRPKGVMIRHDGLVNYICWRLNTYKYRAKDVTLQWLNYVFDGFGANFYSSLLSGGTLVLVPGWKNSDITFIRQTLLRTGVTNLSLVPAMYEALLRDADEAELKTLRFVVLAGEKAAPGLIVSSRGKNPHLQHIIEYGPTEATVTAAANINLEGPNSAILGKPIFNTRIYILDDFSHPVPVGVPGELCISGVGVARGYLNNPELTAERFIFYSHYRSYRAYRSYVSKKLYKTGDLARWLPDGQIEFLGRKDFQVKIRGYRIEPEEIETRLILHPQIKEAVVIEQEDRYGDTYLCAYFVLSTPLMDDVERVLREFLSQSMPAYMIPSAFVRLDAFPLTTAGKIDRKALSVPEERPAKGYTPPGNRIEEKLAALWSEVLLPDTLPATTPGFPPMNTLIGAKDNFFERGGHSLKAMALLTRIQKEFSVTVSLEELFKAPTPRELAAHIINIQGLPGGAEDQIGAVEEKDYYLATPAQKRLYALQQRDDIGTTYNMPAVLLVEGDMHGQRLEEIFTYLINRHESLRTSFALVDGEPVQRVHREYHRLTITNYTLGPCPQTRQEPHQDSQIFNIIDNFVRPFDLSHAPLLRVGLIKTTETHYFLIIDVHHIIADGISMRILTWELVASAKGEILPGLRLRYKDYSEWQKGQQERKRESLLQQEQFWKKKLEGNLPIIDWPADFRRSGLQSFTGEIIRFEIGEAEAAGLHSLALARGTTVYMVLLAAYMIFLAKICNQEDIIIGTPGAGRKYAGLDGIIGMFVNTLVLRNKPYGEKTFRDFLDEVTTGTLAAFDNQDYQYENIIELVGAERNINRNPLFDTMFVQQELGIPGAETPLGRIKPYPYESNTSKFDLLLHCMKEEHDIWFKIEYSTKLFRKDTIERFIGYFQKIIREILADCGRRLKDIDILGDREKQRLLIEFNDTQAGFPAEKTIQRIFAEQVERTPGRVALVGGYGKPGLLESFGGLAAPDDCAALSVRPVRLAPPVSLTYHELNERSGRLAHMLIEKGVRADIIVGIRVERSVDMIIGIRGIVKAGGAYMPIDPEYPDERIKYMLADSGAKILVTDRKDLEIGHCLVIILDLVHAIHGEFGIQKLGTRQNNNTGTGQCPVPTHSPATTHWSPATFLAYIIYTSGSTGKPKGVLVNHKQVVRLFFNDRNLFDFGQEDVWTLFHSFCFDFSVWEMYGALLHGGKLIIIPGMTAKDPGRFWQVLQKEKVTVLNQTPSAFYSLIKAALTHPVEKTYLRYVIFGGEALKPLQLKEWAVKYPDPRLINMFGITETTVHVTYKMIGQEEIRLNLSNIGKPIPTLSAYIMDRNLNLLPIGTAGEMFVGGAGVARGYLNRPELTAERFLSISFKRAYRSYKSYRSYISKKLYKTGDLARWLPQGEMEYLGRIDHQVKIRGFRIELAEIETQLLRFENIKAAVVTAREDADGVPYLCAYVVPGLSHPSPSGTPLDIPGLRQYLAGILPAYMIPAYFVELKTIPLTSNGKVDLRHLPEPVGITAVGLSYEPPQGEIEIQMAETWTQVLGLTQPGIKDSFFSMGGDSIRAIKLISLINARLKTDFKIKDLYAHQTIRELAALVEQNRKGYSGDELNQVEQEIKKLKQRILAKIAESIPLDHSNIEDLYPMSNIEKGLVFYYLKSTGAAVYHDQFIYPLKFKGFEVEVFRKAMALLVEKHPILRTGFNVEDFEVSVQVVFKTVLFDIPYFDLSPLKPPEQEEYIHRYLQEDKRHPFNASIPPLVRMAVFSLDKENIYVGLIFHHAVLDGWSAASLMTQLHNTYLGLKSDPHLVPDQLHSSYRDVIVEEMVELRRPENHRFWTKELKNYKRLEFPRVLKKEGTFTGMKTYGYDLGRELLAQLKQRAKNNNASVKDLCFGGYVFVLSMLCNERDITVGSVTHNRPQKQDGEKVLGCFLNTVPVRIILPGAGNWTAYLGIITAKMQEIKKYERVSLFEIARLIGEKSQDQNPIFDTLFNFVDFHVFLDAGSEPGAAQHMVDSPFFIKGNQDTNTLFDFEISITFGEFILCPKYNPLAISEEMVQRSCVYFERILKKFVDDPFGMARKDEIIPEEEKRKILEEFNCTAADYHRNRLLHELFEVQVEKTSDQVAVMGRRCSGVEFRHHHLTYSELNKKSNRLARLLRKMGLKPGELAGVVIDRSLEMVQAVMGVLKAGGAYVPLEPYLPHSRTRKLLESLKVKFIITDHNQLPMLNKIAAELNELEHIFCLTAAAPGIQPEDTASGKAISFPWYLEEQGVENLSQLTTSQDIAYIIFTSGSTGTPKGVVVCHRSVINVIEWVNRTFHIGTGDKLMFVSSLGFDLSVYDIFGILACGAGNRVVSSHDLKEPQRLLNILLEEGITFWDSAPAALQQLVPFLSEIKPYGSRSRFRLVFLSGDWIPVTLPDALKGVFNGLEVIGLGGATEAAIWSNYYPISSIDPAWVSIPYGKPIQNAEYYILDPQMNICPLLVPGDLYIGGECLASGYINDVELTAEKFVESMRKKFLEVQEPFYKKGLAAPTQEGPNGPSSGALIGAPRLPVISSGHRNFNKKFLEVSEPFYKKVLTRRRHKVYKTGDMARWFLDGNMEFLGRKDLQVKIRGFRIELGEIEAQLLSHDEIKDAVVIARGEHAADKYLCAYLVSDKKLGIPGLKEYLSGELPDYMIPKYFFQVESIPLTPNGKVDRKALPGLEFPGAADNYAAPRNDLEKKLVKIWEEVLGRDTMSTSPARLNEASVEYPGIGIDDDFFELGGHSLNAAVVISKIHKQLNVKIPLAELFHKPTIRKLAGVIPGAAKDKYASLAPVEKKEYYILSSGQRRLYFLQRLGIENTVYNMPQVMQLKGDPDKTPLEQTFRKIIRRQDSFRTSFEIIAEEPVQRVHEKVDFKIENFLLPEDKTKVFGGPGTFFQKGSWPPEAFIKHFFRPFDLSLAPLLRVGLIELPLTPAGLRGHPFPEGKEKMYLLMLDMHHIISDGTSMGILIQEFITSYKGGHLAPLQFQYSDFSEGQVLFRESQAFKDQGFYWRRQFVGAIPVLNLPYDYPRPKIQSLEGSAVTFEWEKTETMGINRLARQQGTTLYTVLLAMVKVWLFKLSGQEDIVVGTPVEGRRRLELQGTIGMFVNTLALRNFPTGDKTFTQFLIGVKEKSLDAFENQEYPFEDLVEQLNIDRELGRNPLFDVMLVLQNMEIPGVHLPDLTLMPYPLESRTTKFDLTLTAVERGNRLDLLLEYCTALFKKETILRFIRYFNRIAAQVTENPGLRLSEIEIIDDEEKERILYDFNDTGAPYPKDKTIHRLFAEQVERSLDHTALRGKSIALDEGRETWEGICGSFPLNEAQLTYRELHEQSDRSAQILRENGVEPDVIVGIKVERSIEMVVGILGILKAGGAYLPIDPGYPPDRVSYMLADSSAKILLSERRHFNCQWSMISSEGGPCSVPTHSPATGHWPPATSLAYIIYTSGTTGKPKGAAVEHHSLVNRLFWMQKKYPLSQSDTILHKTPFTFDVSVWEIFWWVVVGARVCLLAPGKEKDPQAITAAVMKNRVTVMHFVPPMLKLFLEYLQQTASQKKMGCLRHIIASGEVLTISQVKAFKKILYDEHSTGLANLYGPTEATIDVSYFDCFPAGLESPGVIPIGKPIDNIRLYILDKYVQVQPVGIAGELCIAGVGLARGYLNKPELTNKKFLEVSEPFFKKVLTRRRRKVYKTGDLARWLPDGNIDFLGRIDHQVKIRGFRIEPAEIENRLLEIKHIKEAVVIAQENENREKSLCAYVVTDRDLEVSELKEYLSKWLPDYMVPPFFKRLERIPLTANGKVDRAALFSLGRLEIGSEYAAPGTPTEIRIAEIWQEILHRKDLKPGLHDNFFDLGGTSMDVIRINGRLAKELKKEIPLVVLYKYTTIRALAQVLDHGETLDQGSYPVEKRMERVEKGRGDKNKMHEIRRKARQLHPGEKI